MVLVLIMVTAVLVLRDEFEFRGGESLTDRDEPRHFREKGVLLMSVQLFFCAVGFGMDLSIFCW